MYVSEFRPRTTYYSMARVTERPYFVVMYPRSIQSGRAPRPSFVDDEVSLGSLLFGGTVSASVTMAANPSSQFTAPRTPFTYASASTLSAFDPPCVAPLKNDERASGMKPSNLQMSIMERMSSSYAVGCRMCSSGVYKRNWMLVRELRVAD